MLQVTEHPSWRTPPPGGIPARVPSADTTVPEGDGREVAGDGAGGGLLLKKALPWRVFLGLGLTRQQIHCISLYPTVSSCTRTYLAVSSCILPYPTASKTGYGQKYTVGEG